MDITTIDAKILEAERQLLQYSERVNAVGELDNMNNWIIKVVSSENELSKALHFPIEPESKEALLTLIRKQSPLTQPLVSLLAKRISEFIVTIPEVYRNTMRGPLLDPLLHNFQPLLSLVHKYHENFEVPKSISGVHEAMKTNSLHQFKSRPKEPDIRVVLRAFYEDESRDDRNAIQDILEFVFDQLKQNMSGHGFQPRHAWWGVLTLITEANDSWLENNQDEISKIVEDLLKQAEYSPKAEVNFQNVVPELDSKSNEKSWGTINQLRLLKRNLALRVKSDVILALEKRIENNIKAVTADKAELSIKFLQNKLLLLYEALSYYNNVRAKNLSKISKLDITKNRLGKLYYIDVVLAQFKPIFSSIKTLIAKPNLWQKATMTSMLLSSTPSQGKSALIEQIADEIAKMAAEKGRKFCQYNYALGKVGKIEEGSITSFEQVLTILESLQKHKDENLVRLVSFDEFDKAKFDFYLPFLDYLEKTNTPDTPITIYIFSQSGSPTAEIFKSFTEASRHINRSMPDFETRLKLGYVDLPDLKTSPEQRLYSLIGMAKIDEGKVRGIDRNCLTYFATNEKILGPRELRSQKLAHVVLESGVLTLKPELEEELILTNKGDYTKGSNVVEIIS